MQEGGEGESPRGKLTSQRNPHQEAERADNTLSRIMQEGVFDKLSDPEPGWEPAYWPIRLMDKLQYDLAMKAPREGPPRLGEKLPMEKSLEKIKMAYEIIAYPHLENRDVKLEVKDAIRDALENPGIRTDEFPHRAPIELTDAEVRTLSKLTQAMELPFDPDKRIYRYAELAPLREAEEIAAKQSPLYKKAVQNAIDAGMVRERAKIREKIRFRQVEWDVENAHTPPESSSPEPEK